MIHNIRNSIQSLPVPKAAAPAPSQNSGKVLAQTPFGNVLVDEMSTPDIKALFGPHPNITGGAQTVATPARATAAPAQASINRASMQTATQSGTASTRGQGSTSITPRAAVASTATTTTTTSNTPPASSTPATPAAQTTGAPAPTAESVFGTPWISNPTGYSAFGTSWNFNPIYFATQQTAQTIAQQVGGKVIQTNAMLGDNDGPNAQTQKNFMVQLPNGGIINPGLVADFYNHGYSQQYIDQMIQMEVNGTVPA